MALVKTYMTPKGPASYWIAGLIQVDNFNKTAYGRLYGFFNKEVCDMDGGSSLTYLDFNIAPDVYDYYFSKEIMVQEGVTPQTQFYTYVKDKGYRDGLNNYLDFSNAEDVF